MNPPENSNISEAVPIHLRQRVLETAEAFAAEQVTSEKARQVYLNTLAVGAVNEYLTLLGIPTNLEQSDAWHREMRAADNMADLPITETGTIECLPIPPGTTATSIPLEARIRRLAYLVVEVATPFKVAHILGFAKSPVNEQGMLTVGQLHPLDALPEYLSRFHQSYISQWFQNKFSDVWQLPDTVLASRQPAFRFRAQSHPLLQRARVIELGKYTDLSLRVGLHLTVRSHNDSYQVLVRLCPAASEKNKNVDSPTLPSGLVLAKLSDEGDILEIQTARSMTPDEFIQLNPFEALPNEQYQIQVRYGDMEAFEILSL
ncbi:MAG: DUF1822 family protein [Cyanobacteria bacterium P01_H01_bin.21]